MTQKIMEKVRVIESVRRVSIKPTPEFLNAIKAQRRAALQNRRLVNQYLSVDDDYSVYAAKVRYRFIPFLI
jgi:hypothetical protein